MQSFRLNLQKHEEDELALVYYLDTYRTNKDQFLARFVLAGHILLHDGPSKFILTVVNDLKTSPMPPHKDPDTSFLASTSNKSQWRISFKFDCSMPLMHQLRDLVIKLPEKRKQEYLRRCAITGYRQLLIVPNDDISETFKHIKTSPELEKSEPPPEPMEHTVTDNVDSKEPASTGATRTTESHDTVDSKNNELDPDDPLSAIQGFLEKV